VAALLTLSTVPWVPAADADGRRELTWRHNPAAHANNAGIPRWHRHVSAVAGALWQPRQKKVVHWAALEAAGMDAVAVRIPTQCPPQHRTALQRAAATAVDTTADRCCRSQKTELAAAVGGGAGRRGACRHRLPTGLPVATYLAARSIPLSPCGLIGLLRRAFCSKLLTTSKSRGQRRRRQGCDQAVGSGSSSRRGVRLAHPFKTRGAISPGVRLAKGCDWRRQRC
jgi:hypothetical protein